jgi:hypothetical protein
MPMAPGGDALGALDGRADDAEVGLAAVPLWPPNEHPTTTNKPAARTALNKAVINSGRPLSEKRTISIYATLTSVMEWLGFCECCRP